APRRPRSSGRAASTWSRPAPERCSSSVTRPLRWWPASSRCSCATSTEAGRLPPLVTQCYLEPSSALRHRHERALVGADVGLPRPRDLLLRVAQHLLPLGDPPGQPAEREEHREVVGRVAHRLVDQARVEVDVRVELARDEVLVLERVPLELERDLQL